MKFFVIVFFATHLVVHADLRHDWNYGEYGPDVWSERYPLCAGHSQSPINILTACTVYKQFNPFSFGSSYSETHHFTLLNNGHTILGTFDTQLNSMTTFHLSGSDFNDTFDFVNFHVHWGENHNTGSEHEVNAVKYAGELHFVYRNNRTSQTAVLGIFMQSVVIDNNTDANYTGHFFDQDTRREWLRFFNVAKTLDMPNDSIGIELNLANLMGDDLNEFWRYEGSLTTPPCTEGVIWTLFKQPIMFVESEFESFREKIYFEDYRRPQPLYERIIYRNFLNETLSTIPDYNCCPKKPDYNFSTIPASSTRKLSLSLFLLFITSAIKLDH